MNNKPVAWIPKGMTLAKPKDLTDCIPLYTHPHSEESVKVNELTDEEILREWVDATYLDASQCTDDIKEFARAILRKAQE